MFFLFVVGVVVGSFINCVVFRLNHNLSPLRGRSICPKCKHQLAWRDNIPLISFILLGEKCRYCHKPISWQYPLVELASAIFTVAVIQFAGYELRVTSYELLITYSLIAIFVSDLLYGTIPDEVVGFGVIVTLIFLVLQSPFSLVSNFFTGIMVAAFFLFLVLITRHKGMGMGDVKFALLMGLILGWPKIIVALSLAFLTGAIAGVILILFGKKGFGQTIPFGPFLSMATWVAIFLGKQMLESYQLWFLK